MTDDKVRRGAREPDAAEKRELESRITVLEDALRRIEQCTIPWIKRIAREALAEAGVKAKEK